MDELSYQGVRIAQGRAQDRERQRINETIYRYFLAFAGDSLAAGTLAEALTGAVADEMQRTGADAGPALARELIRRLDIKAHGIDTMRESGNPYQGARFFRPWMITAGRLEGMSQGPPLHTHKPAPPEKHHQTHPVPRMALYIYYIYIGTDIQR